MTLLLLLLLMCLLWLDRVIDGRRLPFPFLGEHHASDEEEGEDSLAHHKLCEAFVRVPRGRRVDQTSALRTSIPHSLF